MQDPLRPEPIHREDDPLPDDIESRVYEIWLEAAVDDRSARVRQLIEGHPEHAAGIRAAADELERGSGLLEPVASLAGATQRVGEFALREVLGEGGFATVYRAVQTAPVRRVVALKLLHSTRSTSRAAQRFELERDALASMQHPGIARMFEAGTAPDGRPYFAMELVDGPPITEFADREGLDVGARVRLFLPVCEAVQHAHQCGVVHRDLKPSNVLVGGTGAVAESKVIDFGLAKFADEVRASGLTVDGTLLGTLEYMSPEQAVGGVVDTRSDVWSLGVILFELLTGELPIPRATFQQLPLPEIVTALRKVTPRRASSVARAGGRLEAAGELEAELDWALMRALDPDPSRRYSTVAEFARDLRNYLEDLPVEARPPSRSYMLRKFARRHRAAVGIVGAVFAVVVVAMALVLAALFDANLAREEAERARSRAEASSAAANMAAGFAALDLNRVQEVRARLSSVPPLQRRWEWNYLNSRVDSSIRVWRSEREDGWHGTALCGDWLVVAALGDLRVYSVTDAADTVVASRTDTGDYPRLASSPDGTEVLELDSNGRARILSVPGLHVVHEVQPENDAGGATPAWSPDGAWIALGDDAGACRVMRRDGVVEGGAAEWSVSGFGSGVRPCFDPAGRRVACIGQGGTLHVVDLASRQVLCRAGLIDPERHVFARALTFAPDGRSLACAFTDGSVIRVDAESGRPIWSVNLGEGRLSDLAFVTGGHALLVAGGYALSTLVLIDFDDGRTLHRYAGHTTGVEGIGGVRGGVFYTASRDGSARAWHAEPGPRPLVLQVGRGVGDVMFAGDDRLVTISRYGTLRTWDLDDGHRIAEAVVELPGGRLGFDPVRGEVVVATQRRLTRLGVDALRVKSEHDSPVDWPFDVVHAPDRDGFVVGGRGQLALHAGADLGVGWLVALGDGFVAVDRSPDGRRYVAASTEDAACWLLDRTGAVVRRWDMPAAVAIGFAPDGVLAAAMSRDRVMRVWDTRTGVLEHQISTPGGYGLGWSPDGTRVATGCADGVVRICDPNSDDVVVSLRSASDCVDAEFSSDGRRLASLAGPLNGPAVAFVWSVR